MNFAVLFVCFWLFRDAWSQTNPYEDPFICGLATCAGNGKFKYGPGTQQNYEYSVEASSLFNGTSKNESTLYLKGSVSLSFTSACEGVLSLSYFKLIEKNTDFYENPNSEQFSNDLSANPLKFAFKDGDIYQICPVEEETEWVLNFKRGILNMLHNTMKRWDLDYTTTEMDVRGSCPAQYHVVGAKETSLLIRKTKQLNACQGIGKIHCTFQSMSLPYYSMDGRKENILKSSSECMLSVDHNIYNRITCEETHLLQPFASGESGATTFIKQELVLVEETNDFSNGEEQEIRRRLPLQFDHKISVKPTTDDVTKTDELLKSLCKHDKLQSGMDYSEILRKFIYSLRTVSYDSLKTYYERIGSVCATARKHFLDALPYVNTGPSVTLMKDIILQKTIPQNTINDWILSIAFIPDTTDEMVDAASELMRKTDFSHEVALGMSSLMHTYCVKHSNCRENNMGVQSGVQYLENFIQESFRRNIKERNTHDDLIVALKALSNIGTISEDFNQNLKYIIENFQTDPALRVAAVEVFRRLPCDDSRPYFETLFRNPNEEVEVRIASYLQMMRCPDYMLIRTIRSSLLHEEVNQVGSFVWTHLNNLLTTAVPFKVEIQSLLSEEDIIRKFSSDVRKFSRNFEGSTYFDDYDIGGNYESNIIFSPSSYVPKSAMLNLTTIVFGESVNLLEIYGRIDGFEHYLESLFGPKGTANDFKNSVLDHLRLPRSVKSNEILKEQLKELPNVFGDTDKEPKVSFGMKIFGNELNYMTLNGEKEIQEAVGKLSPLYVLESILSGKEIQYNKEGMFLDSKYIVPTGAGLPLSLSVTGTATANMKLFGSLLNSKFSKDKELELDLVARIEPTVSLDVVGEMSVDAFYSSTGIKLKANMLTDTAVKSEIKIRGSRLISAKISLPKKNNEIIHVRSELLVKQNDVDEIQAGITDNRISSTMCSWDTVEKTIGLKLCSSYSVANVSQIDSIPYFVIAGPTSYRFFVHKADPTANVYFFEYKWTPKLVSVIFDTPGSNVKRLFSGNLTTDRQTHNLTVVLQSSEGTLLLKGHIINKADLKKLQFTASINGKEHFDASASLQKTIVRNGYIYKPIVYVAINKERIFVFKGSVDLLSKRGISQYTVNLNFETKRMLSKLFGYISTTETSLETSLYSDYKFRGAKEQRLSIKFGVANRSPTNMVVLVGFCNLNSSAYPNLNIDTNVTFQRSGSHMDLTIKVKQAPFPEGHPEAEYRKLTFDSLISYKTYTDNKRTWEAKASLVKRSSNLEMEGMCVYETFRHNVNIISELRYGRDKTISTTLLWSRPKQPLEDIKLHVNVTVPSFTPMVVRIGILEKQSKAFIIDFFGTWFSGHEMTAVAFYNDKSTTVSSSHYIKLLVKSPSFKDTKVDGFYYRDNKVFKFMLEANYDDELYQISNIHKSISNEETYIQATVKYKAQVYRFVSTFYDGGYKKMDVEIHFDEYRDIIIWCYLLNDEHSKTLDVKFNWDANRDPNQKLLFTANYKKKGDFNYQADAIMSYPGRTIKGDYIFLLKRGHLNTLATVSWDENRTAGLNLGISYEFEDKIYLSVNSDIYTPLDNWKIIKIEGIFEHVDNKYATSGFVSWDKDQKVEIHFLGDYISKEYFWCKYSFSVDSSSGPMPNINMTISHLRNDTDLSTIVYLLYSPEFILDVDSYWKITASEHYKNLTGTVIVRTPFKGLGNSALLSKIVIKDKNYMVGIADLDVNKKKLSINMEGKFKKITDCMLIVNATSLDDYYQLRFLISTEKRHFVGMLTYPDGNLGTEVLLSFNSIINFDVKLQLGTPIEFLQKVLVVARLKPEEANFRITWNVLSLGFAGIWHYEGLTDFEYVYKLYTPIRNYEENGVEAKLIIDDGLDLGFSIQLSIFKLGLKLFGKEKHLLKDIGVDFKDLYSHIQPFNTQASVDDLQWEGAIEVDIIIYPTMKGVLELTQRGRTYFLQSKLVVPHGVAYLVDEFCYQDILTMKNNLYVTTPYNTFKVINSNFELEIKAKKKYIFSLGVDYHNNTEVVKMLADVRYEAETEAIFDKFYNLSANIITPLKSFPKLTFLGVYEREENFYHPKLVFNTARSDIFIDTTLEIDDGLLEVNSDFYVTTAAIYIPRTQIHMTKRSSEAKNQVEVNINSPKSFDKNINLRTSWLIKDKTDFEALVQISTPFSGLETTKAGLKVYDSNDKSTLWVILQLHPVEFEVNSTLRSNHLTADSYLVLKEKKYPITVNCKILDTEENLKMFDGTLTISNTPYSISGNASQSAGIIKDFFLKLTPRDDSSPVIFEYHVEQRSLNDIYLTGYIQHLERTERFKAHLLLYNIFSWEFSTELDTSRNDKFSIDSQMTSSGKIINLVATAETPILQMEHLTFNGTLNSTDINRSVNAFMKAGNLDIVGNVWTRWKFLEDMIVIGSGSASNGFFNKSSSINLLYNNPSQAFYHLLVAADVRIDSLWDFGMNTTLRLPKDKTAKVSQMGLDGNLRVPNGNGETHSINSNLDYTKSMQYIKYLLKYGSTHHLSNYGVWGTVNSENRENVTGIFNLEWESLIYENYGNFNISETNIELNYKLKTPQYANKHFVVTNIIYVPLGKRYNVTLEGFHPEDRRVVFITSDFAELINMKGKLNVTIPHATLKYVGAHYDFETTDAKMNRYVKLYWPTNDALLDSKCTIERGVLLPDSYRKGKLTAEIPLKTRHIIKVDYKYNETGQLSDGIALVNYNGDQLLEGIYKSISESRAGQEKETVHAEIKNKFLPIAADYLHKYEYGATQDDDTLDSKDIRIYNTQNRTKFDIKGLLEVHDVWGGKEYTVTAIHGSKTVKLMADYNILDQIFKQHSRIELNPIHWLEYDLSIVNRTKDDIHDAQEVTLELTYPQRSFTTKASYNISETMILGDMSAEWDEDKKTVSCGLNWNKQGPYKDQLQVIFKHPTFEKDVSFLSEYDIKNLDGQLIVDYSLDPDKRLTIKGKLSDTSHTATYNYTCRVEAEHNATNLKFDSTANVFWKPTSFANDHVTRYQRSYLPVSVSETLLKIDLDNNEIELKKDIIASGYSYFWGRYGGDFPVYTVNMSSVYNDDKKYNAEFLVNFKRSLMFLHMNLTEDGSQSMHMNGIIPDARSIIFNVWRQYDELTISDIAYYLRLNHSRLVTSRLKWRPELYDDVQYMVRNGALKLYSDFLEGINNTKHYIKSEAMDAMNGIWQDAKPIVQEFLSDLKNLTVIEQDIEELKQFLIKSYEANDFYIKDITNITLSIFDELALKSHIQSLPKMIQELWSMMGESGEKIKKSILWVIEEIKIYYKNTTEFIHGLITGDPIEHLSTGLEKLLEKYDGYIKNLHITVLQYIESLWSQTYDLLVDNWHKFLAGLEPTFLKFAHYVETLAWTTGREVLDFFYLRKNEFIESPYFVKFAKFSQDVDKFYRDITGNNTITATFKYVKLGWTFLKEKFVNSVPFGKEVLDVLNEIIDEMKQIGEIPSVKFLIDKYNEFYESLQYYYNYFGMESKIQRLVVIIYKKLSELSLTAIDIDDRHREAKTKFIFEPNDGIMILEQKLPMSWHAFNETPNFKEIPEIKKLFDIVNFIDTSKTTFWDIYSNYMMISDSSTWFPPFKGRAMIIGGKYFITFDKRHYTFQGSCTYLLANDFVDHNFTLLMSYDQQTKNNELIIILDKTIIRTNLKKNTILIGDSERESLPVQIGEVYLYRTAGLFIMQSITRGFHLECNIKYEVCSFEILGWYSGKTAGLLGTFNNEPGDDFLLPNVTNHGDGTLSSFVHEWSLDKKCKTQPIQSQRPKEIPQQVQSLCDEFFLNKVSQLSDCFSRVPKEYFYSICLNGTTKKDACMAAISYIDECSYAYTQLRIPDTCVQCTMSNGTEIKEGDPIRLEGANVPKHADVVFIVEAKQCNKNLKQSKNFDTVVDLIEKELLRYNFTNNRYAVVTFGGDGVFDEPRSLILDGETFVNSKAIAKYFDKVIPGKGNEDIFNAIIFAFNLIFRPESTKSFILVPCSECNIYNMEYDYATVHQSLSESAISLHILMSESFQMQKEGELRIPYGIDRQYAYTKRDVRGLVGDQSLRKSLHLPKAFLGQCLSLAFETNGTVFSTKFLETDKKNAKKFCSVFSQVIARSIVPPHCKDCECTASDNGVSYMECYLCTTISTSKNNAEMLLAFEGEDLTSINLFEDFNL